MRLCDCISSDPPTLTFELAVDARRGGYRDVLGVRELHSWPGRPGVEDGEEEAGLAISK
jgi:hypothetical protein